jgi:mannosyltransferase OCH1-like enzyme
VLAKETAEYAQAAVDAHPLTPVIVNEASRFVVATYWWGRGKDNANTQAPCPYVFMIQIRNDLEEKLYEEDARYTDLIDNEWQPLLDQVESPEGVSLNPTPEVWNAWLAVKAKRTAFLNKYFAKPETKKRIAEVLIPQYTARPPSTNTDPLQQGDGGLSKKPIKFETMLARWEETCKAAGCNYLTVEYPEFAMFGRYQAAINAKPLFIKKAVQSCGGRGVLYIDGDMFVRKYPKIFDVQNVDFMAQGWNCDPRSNMYFKEDPCFDPYIFETSGGTMFYANTPASLKLLDVWAAESHKPENYGKADDRILSMVFTMQNMVLPISMIQLPIEYLWLTDKYAPFDFQGAADVGDVFIEHPECLTAEEAAADQGASNDRYPPRYQDEITRRIACDRPGGIFYEYIAFPNPGTVEAFAPYLKYMKETINPQSGKPMFIVIPFEETFGPYDKVAAKNKEEGKKINVLLPTNGKIVLPFTTTIPEILHYLVNGINVYVGSESAGTPEPGIEIVATNRGKFTPTNYLADLKIDVKQPLFFSSRSRTVKLLLQMCETLEDINKHLYESYIFVSRIRWSIIQQGPGKKKVSPFDAIVAPVLLPVPLTEGQQAAKAQQETEARLVAENEAKVNVLGSIPKKVHQIWFGGEIPPWRQYLFDLNKAAAERNGYTYRLWQNADRTPENFKSTIAYQDDAIKIGSETGQSRWAQVADLARLEIVYTKGGVYIDSLFETGDDFYKKITELSENDAKFIVANEDPCGLDCVGAGGKKYLSNSFFAAVQWSKILERLVVDTKLANIDLKEKLINQTTGPYYLREGIVDPVADGVILLETEQIYPFPMSGSVQRPVEPNPFVMRAPSENSIEVKPGMYLQKDALATLQATREQAGRIKPLALYQVGLGGTWSV